MLDESEPETPVSGEERIIDCGAMGVVRWEVSQSMWDYLQNLPADDRERILDIVTQQLHAQCHAMCGYVVRFVQKRSTESEEKETITGSTFPESWLDHD